MRYDYALCIRSCFNTVAHVYEKQLFNERVYVTYIHEYSLYDNDRVDRTLQTCFYSVDCRSCYGMLFLFHNLTHEFSRPISLRFLFSIRFVRTFHALCICGCKRYHFLSLSCFPYAENKFQMKNLES